MFEQTVTYQVTHVLFWFGDVELHLVFNQELESQVMLGGIEVVSLWDEERQFKKSRITCYCYTKHSIVAMMRSQPYIFLVNLQLYQ